jgi:hypothetical protein
MLIGVTEQTYYRWRKEYGGIRMDQAKRMKDLEKENARLKRLLADAALDKAFFERPLRETSCPAKRRQPCNTCGVRWARSRSLSVGCVDYWHNLVRPSVASDTFRTTNPGSFGRWWSWPRSTVGTGIAG